MVATPLPSGRFVPDRGDICWLDFNPQAGHEQAGRRPALVITPRAYNVKTGLLIACPITNHSKAYPFEVALPGGWAVTGVILSDHVKSFDWKARRAVFACRVSNDIVADVLAKLTALVAP